MRVLKLTARNATPADVATVNELLKPSYPELTSFCYDAAILADALPLFTKVNPRLLSAGIC